MNFDALKTGLAKANQLEKILPENLVMKAQEYLINYLKSIWTFSVDDSVISYEEALAYVTGDKSPGYPFYYNHQTKSSVLDQDGVLIQKMTDQLMQGIKLPCYFNLTLKSELRPVEKVALNKTRVFMASPLHHLMACYRLFTKQNEFLQDKRYLHPITIGIQLPGPEYVRRVSQLGDLLNDGDVSGCDLRFNLRLARVIRDIRLSFLPPKYAKVVRYLYNTVYCGVGVCSGNMYRIYGNKSGWHNTGHDNSLQVWLWLIMASFHYAPTLNPSAVFDALINGDDLLIKWKLAHVTFHEVCSWMEGYHFYIEADNWAARRPDWCVFLSHHIEERFVSGFGDILVAAGNLPKLLSSLNWVKTNVNLTYEESCVAHLVGLRFCLFPWAIYFEECDQILSDYLRTIQLTPFIMNCLQARFNEKQMALLHTRMEGFVFPNHSGIREIDKALKGIPDHLIKLIRSFCAMTKTKSQKARKKNGKSKSIQQLRRRPLPPVPRSNKKSNRNANSASSRRGNSSKTEGRIAKIGRYIGTGAKAFFKAVTGFGDYNVATNSILGKNEVPIVANANTGAGVIVRHREYICDIVSANEFHLEDFPINPGLAETFPWLSSIAMNFEEYQVRGMIFEFKSMSSPLNSNVSSSALGTVIMATSYNVLNPLFPDKRTMENYEFACSDKPSNTFVHPIECAKNQTPNTHLYVRTGEDLGVTGDKRLYDLGTFQIASQGMPEDFEGSGIGELWCTYEVELFKPKLQGDTGIQVLADVFHTTGGAQAALFTSGNAIAEPVAGSTCGCVLRTNSIYFPSTCHGRFWLHFVVSSTGNTNPTMAVSATSFVTVVPGGSTNSQYTMAAASGGYVAGGAYSSGNVSQWVYSLLVDVTNGINADNPNITFNLITNSVNLDVSTWIVQVPPNFNNVTPSYPGVLSSLSVGVSSGTVADIMERDFRKLEVDHGPKIQPEHRGLHDLTKDQILKLKQILGA